MKLVRLVSVVALTLVPALAQTSSTNPVNVDQVVTLQATLSSLNQTPPVFTSPATTTPGGTATNTVSTGTARLTIRFIGGNSTNVNPTTGVAAPITGTTANVSRATVAISFSSNFVNNETITGAQIIRRPGSTTNLPTGAGTAPTAAVFDFNLPSSTPVNSGQQSAINTQIDVTNQAQLAALREIVNNPEGFFLNVKTQSSTLGLVSGELHRAGDSADEVTNNRMDLTTQLVVRMAYKNGVITSAERDSYLATLPPTPAPVTPPPSTGADNQ